MTTQALFEKYYFSRPDFINGTEHFHQLCSRHIPRSGRILEIGAGPSNSTSDFLATLGAVTGVDISEEVAGNRALSEWCTFKGRELPVPDESFDACVSNYVLEHVKDPSVHFREVFRVLKPAGIYCFRTPNLYHYVTAISRITPQWFHDKSANRLRGLPPDAHTPWPTVYGCNTLRSLQSVIPASGLVPVSIETIEKEPSYGRLGPFLFFPMLAWERIVNAGELFRMLRANLFGVARKPDALQGSELRSKPSYL